MISETDEPPPLRAPGTPVLSPPAGRRVASRGPRPLRTVWFLSLLGLFAAPGGLLPAHAQQPVPQHSQYDVKAAFLYHFIKYVTWPSDAFAAPDDPVVIGVLGEDPFGDILTTTLARENPIRGRGLRIVRSRTVADLARCHILFISGSEQSRLREHFAALGRARSAALTVGESEDFLHSGGAIRFVLENHKVRFEIAAAAAERAGLSLSSKLLSLARNTRDRN